MKICFAVAAADALRMGPALAGLCMMLAGCASFESKPIDPQVEASKFEAQALGPGPWDAPALQRAALQRHPEAMAAEARRKVAEAAVITAGGRLNPSLAGVIQKNVSAGSGTEPWTYGVTLEIPLETAGKRASREARAQWLALAAAYIETDVRWRIQLRTREAYVGAYPTDELAARRLDTLDALALETQKRLKAGLVSSNEALQTRLAARQAALSLEEARRRRGEALRRLAASIGIPERAILEIDLSHLDISSESLPDAKTLDALAKNALQARPDVLAALAEYEASQATLQLEIARQYPNVSIGPGYSWDAGDSKWSLGFALPLPLLNRNRGPIAEAEAQREAVAAAFRVVQEQAIAEITGALAAYRQTIRALAIAQAAAEDTKALGRSAELAFRAGATDRLALLAVRLEAITAESTQNDLMLAAHAAAGRLEYALRMPLPPTSPTASKESQP